MDIITRIGKTNFRNTNQIFGIKDADRLGHIYVIGKTGVGKSTLLLNMVISDIPKGKGLCIIDPHGDIAESILDYVPQERLEDVIYFNPKDIEYPIAFNPLRGVHPNYHHLVASGLISTFKKIWTFTGNNDFLAPNNPKRVLPDIDKKSKFVFRGSKSYIS